MTFDEFTRTLTNAPGGYEIVETRPDGTQHTYRGRDVSAFIARGDHRQHEHRVTNAMGATVYHRDAAGTLHEGAAWQYELNVGKQDTARKVGSALLWGARGRPDNPVGDIVRKGFRWGSGRW
jgi:hypothetical protein